MSLFGRGTYLADVVFNSVKEAVDNEDMAEAWDVGARLYKQLSKLNAPLAIWRYLMIISVHKEINKNLKDKATIWIRKIKNVSTYATADHSFDSVELLWVCDFQKLERVLGQYQATLPLNHIRILQTLRSINEGDSSLSYMVEELYAAYEALLKDGFTVEIFTFLFEYDTDVQQPLSYKTNRYIQDWCSRQRRKQLSCFSN